MGKKRKEQRGALDDLPDVLTPSDVMRVLRVGRNAVYEALRSGKIRSVRLGQRFLVPKAAVREFLNERKPRQE